MTKQLFNTNPLVSSDVLFRAWGSAYGVAFAAAGLVQTADAGQINWVTVVKPAASTKAGYEIWRFNDSLQGSAPIYIRFDYGCGANAGATTANIWVTIGTGSNGSGTITGTTQKALATTNASFGSANIATNASSANYVACPAAGGSFVLIQNERGYDVSTRPGCGLVIDRSRDANGAPTATGATVYWLGAANGSAVVYVQSYGFNFAVPAIPTGPLPPNSILPDATAAANGATVYVGLQYGAIPYPINSIACLTYLNGEITQLTTFPCVPMGVTSHTYLALGSGQAGNAAGNQSNAASNSGAANEAVATLAVIYED